MLSVEEIERLITVCEEFIGALGPGGYFPVPGAPATQRLRNATASARNSLPLLLAEVERGREALALVRMSNGWRYLAPESQQIIDAALSNGREVQGDNSAGAAAPPLTDNQQE